MPVEPVEPPAQVTGDPPRGSATPEAEGERVGPLSLERSSKDDGRSLLLFRTTGDGR